MTLTATISEDLTLSGRIIGCEESGTPVLYSYKPNFPNNGAGTWAGTGGEIGLGDSEPLGNHNWMAVVCS